MRYYRNSKRLAFKEQIRNKLIRAHTTKSRINKTLILISMKMEEQLQEGGMDVLNLLKYVDLI